MKKILIIFGIIVIVLLGIYFGARMFNDPRQKSDNNSAIENEQETNMTANPEVPSIETANKEEKTTPNTLMVYKTYYTKCQHYIQEYEDVDISLVNYTQDDLQEKCKGWNIDKFCSEEVELSKEEEGFCNQHYRLKLEDNNLVIYQIDEKGIETEYEQTGITTEYLTDEDVLKLTTGIYVYGKENLTKLLEDYE